MAHYYTPQIMDASALPFLNMIDLSAQRISKLAISKTGGESFRVGLLASPATDKFNIFQDVFDGYGLEAIFSQHDADVLSLIQRIKSEGTCQQHANNLSSIASELEGVPIKMRQNATNFKMDRPIFLRICLPKIQPLIAQILLRTLGAAVKKANDFVGIGRGIQTCTMACTMACTMGRQRVRVRSY